MTSAHATGGGQAGPVIPDWSFGDRMRKIRRDIMDIEQTEMAELLGVKKQAYAAWETGRSQPRDILTLAKRVELATRVPASWLLGFGDDGGSHTRR